MHRKAPLAFDAVDLALVGDGIDALIRIGATRPHLVVMDASMPGIDGVDVCRRLKANPDTSEIAVVLASAHVTANFEEAARKAGARQVIQPHSPPWSPASARCPSIRTRPARTSPAAL